MDKVNTIWCPPGCPSNRHCSYCVNQDNGNVIAAFKASYLKLPDAKSVRVKVKRANYFKARLNRLGITYPYDIDAPYLELANA